MSVAIEEISAVLVTRGDVEMQPILDTLPYAEIIIWNNSERQDLKTYGRYMAMLEASNETCYLQDDDCLFTHHEQLAALHEPGRATATWGHGTFTAGYDDIFWACGGCIIDRDLPRRAINRYLKHFPGIDEEFLYEADAIVGVLTPHVHVDLPFELRTEITERPNRLCKQPWQCEAKMRVVNRCRWIRNGCQTVYTSEAMETPNLTLAGA